MGSGVILPSPKHRRQQQACSSAANPDRTSQPGSNTLLQQTAPGLRPTRSRRHSLASQPLEANDLPTRNQPASDALPTRQSAGSCDASFATNSHQTLYRQSQQVEPSPPTSPNLALHAQAPPSARPSPASGHNACRCQTSAAAHSPHGPSAATRSRQPTSGGFQPRSLPAVHNTDPIPASHPQRDKREGNSARRL